jgi:catechol 2,3-dioxygenase-like lactoylglutathione lyase family enzyme
MKSVAVSLLVEDYNKCFDFYTQKLGFEPTYNEGGYGAFKVGGEDNHLFSIFVSEMMAEMAGYVGKKMPVGCRDKAVVSFEIENVDETYQTLLARGVNFLSEPIDMTDWGMRMVCLRDPEDNLLYFWTPIEMK